MFVADALALLGQPYRYGGNKPGGFDCSGLVEYAANGAGIWVPRTAHQQLRFGRPITRRELRAGDLVFLHLAHKELHVGIALDGDRFVHAPSTGGYIRVDSLERTPYAKGFIGARRIVDTPAAPAAPVPRGAPSTPAPATPAAPSARSVQAAPVRLAPSTGAAPVSGVQSELF